MERSDRPYLEIVNWEDAKNAVIKVNPDLAAAIDTVNPGCEYPLIRARYPFGHQILNHGKFILPFERENADNKFYQECKKLLSYAVTIRTGIVLNNTMELFVESPDMIIPRYLMYPGRIFGLWSSLQPPETSADIGQLWNITAGARSLIMVPKISDSTAFKRVKKEYSLKSTAPNNFVDQWELFVALAKHPAFPERWETEILLFTNKWFEELNKVNPQWLILKNFLLQSAWLDTATLRNQDAFNFVFSMALQSRNLIKDPYLSSVARFLYGLGERHFHSYVVAQDNQAAPLEGIQSIFTNLYNLNYAPTMVHSGIFSNDDPLRPCYYSLSHSSIMDFMPKTKNFASKFNNVLDIKDIMNRTLAYIREDNFGLIKTPVYKIANEVEYSYYHTDAKQEKDGVSHVSKIVERDAALIHEARRFSNLAFCDSSSFFRGCVRIGIKSKK